MKEIVDMRSRIKEALKPLGLDVNEVILYNGTLHYLVNIKCQTTIKLPSHFDRKREELE